METYPPAKALEGANSVGRQFGVTKIIAFLTKIVDPASKTFIAVAGSVAVAMMFLTFFDVGLRYFFNRPILGSMEITEFMMSILVTLSLGYCAVRKGHIRVDLVLMHVSRQANHILDIIANGISAIVYTMVCWQTFTQARSIMDDKLTSDVLQIPVYPFQFLLFLGAALLVIVFVKDTLESIHGLMKM